MLYIVVCFAAISGQFLLWIEARAPSRLHGNRRECRLDLNASDTSLSDALGLINDIANDADDYDDAIEY